MDLNISSLKCLYCAVAAIMESSKDLSSVLRGSIALLKVEKDVQMYCKLAMLHSQCNMTDLNEPSLEMMSRSSIAVICTYNQTQVICIKMIS